jgi:hypothetical protein
MALTRRAGNRHVEPMVDAVMARIANGEDAQTALDTVWHAARCDSTCETHGLSTGPPATGLPSA